MKWNALLAKARRVLTILVFSKVRSGPPGQERLKGVQRGITVAETLACLQRADTFIAQAQELFVAFERQCVTEEPGPLFLLQAAARKLQATRRFLEEGSDILQEFADIDIGQLFPGVTAFCRSDDDVVNVESVDVTLWFVKADDSHIRALREEGYKYGVQSDSIVAMLAEYDSRVEALLTYVELLPDDSQFKGYGCVVNREESEAWIALHRPSLIPRGQDPERPEFKTDEETDIV